MTKDQIKRLIDVSAGRVPADIVIRGAKIVDVFTASLIEGDVAICGDRIAGIGKYEGKEVVDASGMYLAPGFIDSHIHIESSHLSPEEFARIVVPHGTTSVIADPHEIVNVCGMEGFRYMKNAAKGSGLNAFFMVPSCVPATPLDDSGARILAKDMLPDFNEEDVPGLGEMMDFHGVVAGDSDILDKILLARKNNKIIDGHGCALMGNPLNAYIAAGTRTDHECNTIDEMEARISRGMYVELRMGTACHDLLELSKAVNSKNFRRCLICSDDREPDTIFNKGHLEEHLKILRDRGISPEEAITMATLNPCQCYRLRDRGGIAPGMIADIVILEDLENFSAKRVYSSGILVAKDGEYLPTVKKPDITPVKSSVHVKDYDKSRLALKLDSEQATTIGMVPGGVLSEKRIVKVKRNHEGEFVFDPEIDAVKCAVIERHKMTGKIGLGILSGYGLKKGAIALTIAHDSHNIICAGASDEDMDTAIKALIDMGGGIVIALEGEVIESLPLPIAGLMSDKNGEFVAETLDRMQEVAYRDLSVSTDLSPIMSLCFMSLLVIPELKLTPGGLFDVFANKFI